MSYRYCSAILNLHESEDLDKDINRFGVLFFYFDLEYLKDFKVLSRFIQKCLQPPASSAHCFYKIYFFYWRAHFYLMKKSAKVLHYFGLDCGMLEFFTYSTHKPSSKEQWLTLRYIWSPKIADCTHTTRLPKN